MIKTIPVWIVIASILLPIVFASRANPKKSLRLLQWTMIGVTLLWALLCLYLYPQFVSVE